MANVDGEWKATIASPLGNQQVVLTILASGDTFTGDCEASTGTMAMTDGKVNGDVLTWKMDIVIPMPMTVDCTASVSGNTMTGTVKAGAFGSFPLSGTRA